MGCGFKQIVSTGQIYFKLKTILFITPHPYTIYWTGASPKALFYYFLGTQIFQYDDHRFAILLFSINDLKFKSRLTSTELKSKQDYDASKNVT